MARVIRRLEAINDAKAGMSYVYVRDDAEHDDLPPVARTVDYGTIHVDLDADGQAIGVEFFGNIEGMTG